MVTNYESIKNIDKSKWDSFNLNNSPFCSYDFFSILEKSKVIGDKSGWSPRYFLSAKGAAFIFIKYHSYGEYTFDWQWAQAYEQNGLDYYPKITSMSPLSPVSTDHFLGNDFDNLYKAIDDFYKSYNLSSIHFLYLNASNCKKLRDQDFKERINIQYHFYNKGYLNFSQLLDSLKSKKKKQILKERIFSEHLTIKRYTGEDLTVDQAVRMYHFYKQTVDLKRSIPYLNESFFVEIFKRMSSNLLYVEASNVQSPIAGALFFYDLDKLYGRYWGATEDVKNLHFELCYYQGLDFCFEKNLSVFESGAQGEHKIKRGFTPVHVNSAHKFKNPSFGEAIDNYIDQETQMLKKTIEELKENLPFKLDQELQKKD